MHVVKDHTPDEDLLVSMQLAVDCTVEDEDASLAHAVADAAAADLAVVVVGTTEEVESEGFDRTSLALPGRQDELVHRVAAAHPETVVVVNAGAPVLMPWRDEVAATLLAWFPGQEFGGALADVLLGRVEPGGRLPTTWPAAEGAVLPSTTPVDGRLDYVEGLHIGYRRFLRDGVAPAYWFGHGLGYTTWSYDELAVSSTEVTVTVTNTGTRAGRELVQVYLSRADSEVDRPVRWLAAHTWVEAEPGVATTRGSSSRTRVRALGRRRLDPRAGHLHRRGRPVRGRHRAPRTDRRLSVTTTRCRACPPSPAGGCGSTRRSRHACGRARRRSSSSASWRRPPRPGRRSHRLSP